MSFSTEDVWYNTDDYFAGNDIIGMYAGYWSVYIFKKKKKLQISMKD